MNGWHVVTLPGPEFNFPSVPHLPQIYTVEPKKRAIKVWTDAGVKKIKVGDLTTSFLLFFPLNQRL